MESPTLKVSLTPELRQRIDAIAAASAVSAAAVVRSLLTRALEHESQQADAVADLGARVDALQQAVQTQLDFRRYRTDW